MNFGEQASVQCSISGGDWPIEVTWLHDGVEIRQNNMLDVTISRVTKHIHFLAIESVNANHAGDYACLAQNRAGVAKQSAKLIVNGVFL